MIDKRRANAQSREEKHACRAGEARRWMEVGPLAWKCMEWQCQGTDLVHMVSTWESAPCSL